MLEQAIVGEGGRQKRVSDGAERRRHAHRFRTPPPYPLLPAHRQLVREHLKWGLLLKK